MPDLALPKILDTPDFREAWEAFVHHRMHDCRPKCPLSDRAAAILLRKLCAYGPRKAADLLELAVMNGWRGVLFSDSPRPSGKSSDQIDREQRDEKQRQSGKLRERQNAEADVRGRLEAVKKLPPMERERLRLACVADADPKFRRRMGEADPCGGGWLTQLIYAKWVAEGGA